MKVIIAEAISVVLKTPYHGGDADPEAKDIDQGVEFVPPEVSDDDPAVILKHFFAVWYEGIHNQPFSIKSVSFIFS